MSTWFSSDHHIGHTNILRYCSRPYKDINHMNEDFIFRWNSLVQFDDIMWYLGDLSMSMNAMEAVVPRLNGQIRLIAGNHDGCHPVHGKKALRNAERYRAVGIDIFPIWMPLELSDGTAVDLCHMPRKNQDVARHKAEKFDEYRAPESDRWLLHGHTHSTVAVHGNSINVGVDSQNYFPVSEQQIIQLIKENS